MSSEEIKDISASEYEYGEILTDTCINEIQSEDISVGDYIHGIPPNTCINETKPRYCGHKCIHVYENGICIGCGKFSRCHICRINEWDDGCYHCHNTMRICRECYSRCDFCGENLCVNCKKDDVHKICEFIMGKFKRN